MSLNGPFRLCHYDGSFPAPQFRRSKTCRDHEDVRYSCSSCGSKTDWHPLADEARKEWNRKNSIPLWVILLSGVCLLLVGISISILARSLLHR